MGDGGERHRTGDMIYAWRCSSCHHEWQATVTAGAICEWCGEDEVFVEEEKQWPPMCLLVSIKDM